MSNRAAFYSDLIMHNMRGLEIFLEGGWGGFVFREKGSHNSGICSCSTYNNIELLYEKWTDVGASVLILLASIMGKYIVFVIYIHKWNSNKDKYILYSTENTLALLRKVFIGTMREKQWRKKKHWDSIVVETTKKIIKDMPKRLTWIF